MLKRYLPFVWLGLFLILISTRFVNLGWGLPYPMHPDERNMVDAITKLTCDDPAELLQGAIHNLPVFFRTNFLGESAYFGGNTYQKVNCANPHFFAYGQIVLYLGYALSYPIENITRLLTFSQGMDMRMSPLPSFSSIALALRFIAAISSVLTVVICLKILRLISAKTKNSYFAEISLFLLLTFSPVLVQFAHFGTTESVLTLLYVLIIYAVILAQKNSKNKKFWAYILLSVFVSGIAIAAKVSSLVFCIVPLFAICARYSSAILANLVTLVRQLSDSVSKHKDANICHPEPAERATNETKSADRNLYKAICAHIAIFCIELIRNISFFIVSFVAIIVFSFIFSFFFSPPNVISYPEFLGSFSYERDVGTGRYVAFYTRQFLHELPLVFQIKNIFPYALGYVASVLFVIGFFWAPWQKNINLLRFSIIFFSFLTMPWYAKWTRFIAPIYPIMTIFSLLGLLNMAKLLRRLGIRKMLNEFVIAAILFASIAVGLGFVAVYAAPDVRYTASAWVFANIPSGAKILSETANVIDIPIPNPSKRNDVPPGYHVNYVSFDFYSIDENDQVFRQYQSHLKDADYIFVPSRRVFYNHTCVSEMNGTYATGRHRDFKCKMLDEAYPRLKKHYEDLFSGRLGFEKVAEFSSFPRISVFGKTILEFPDESAEETFTVFDHPVIRIYKRTSK